MAVIMSVWKNSADNEVSRDGGELKIELTEFQAHWMGQIFLFWIQICK